MPKNKNDKENTKKIKYGGEPSVEYKQKALFRRTLYNMISYITNKKNSKNKVKEGIKILINFFNNNNMINTLIPVSSVGKFVDKETGKVPIVDFVSPIIFMLDSFSGISSISDNDIIRILDAYFKNGGNFNSLSSRFKISPFNNELNNGRIQNIKMLLDKTNAFHIYEEGLDEETKTKLAEIMPTEQQIIKNPFPIPIIFDSNIKEIHIQQNRNINENQTLQDNSEKFSKQKHKEEVLKKRKELEEKGIKPESLLTKENLQKWLEDGLSYMRIAREKVGIPENEISTIAKTLGLQSNVKRYIVNKRGHK